MPVLLALVAFAFLFAFIQVGIVTVAFDKLGLSAESGLLLVLVSLVGSGLNLPLFQMASRVEPDPRWQRMMRWLEPRLRPRPGRVIVAMNVGGGLVPVAFSMYLLSHNPLPPLIVALAIGLQSVICYLASRPVRGVGIGMPLLVAPLSAALIAMLLLPEHSAPLAYICGTLGVLVGADILRLGAVRELGVPVASVGGAGTFDGIFITGIVAALLA